MADHCTDAAVVHFLRRIRVEERRLQDGGREHDFVLQRVVVRVDRLRAHAPFGLVHRLADLGQVPLVVELLGGHHVAQVAVAAGAQAVPLTPLFRIADLGREALPLGDGLGLGLRAHPVQLFDAGLQRGTQVGHQGFHLGLGIGREGDLDVQLAQRFAGLAVDGGQHALPTRLDFLLAAHGLVVERKVLIDERLAQERRSAIDGVEAKVRAPDRRVGVGDHLAHFLVEGRDRQREHLRCGHALRLEELGPRPVRGQLVGLGRRDRVIGQRGVARHLGAGLGDLGQAGFESDHLLGLRGGIGRSHAGQFQHLGHVRLIRLQLGLVGGAGVVLRVRQAQAALHGIGDVLAGLLEVRFGAEAEKRVVALGRAAAQVVDQLGLVADGVDGGQFRLQRLDALRVDLGFVHAGRPQVADDLFHAGGLAVGGGLFHQLPLDRIGALVEHLERAPAGAVARHRVGGQELGIGVGVQIGTGIAVGVQVGRGELVHCRQLALVQCQRLGRRRGSGRGVARRGRRCGVFGLLATAQGGGHGQGQRQ